MFPSSRQCPDPLQPLRPVWPSPAPPKSRGVGTESRGRTRAGAGMVELRKLLQGPDIVASARGAEEVVAAVVRSGVGRHVDALEALQRLVREAEVDPRRPPRQPVRGGGPIGAGSRSRAGGRTMEWAAAGA